MGFSETIIKNNHQANCVIGGKAPSMYEEKERLATILLCNLLGGPASNSILGNLLREKHGWVYNVECTYTPYSDRGIAVIAFSCDKENLEKCEKAVYRQLRNIREKPLTETRLRSAKKQLLGQNAISMESGETQCIAMGKSLMCFGCISTDEQTTEKIMGISAELVQQMACKVFSEENLNKLVYL